jgi:hypothetical protein
MKKIIFIVLNMLLSQQVFSTDVNQKISNITPNCRDRSDVTHRVCLPPNERIQTYNTSEVGRNGSSSIVSTVISTEEPNCLIIQTTASPLGEDCINLLGTNICNCRGRGWIELQILLHGDSP